MEARRTAKARTLAQCCCGFFARLTPPGGMRVSLHAANPPALARGDNARAPSQRCPMMQQKGPSVLATLTSKYGFFSAG
jgi:hypothetical protein